jgi:hypothetical protein
VADPVIPLRYAALGLWFLSIASCASDTLPADVVDYQTRCTRMNAHPIPRYDGDPHAGTKNVYACNVDQELLRTNARPFPDGTVIVKDSTKENVTYRWLVATARKQGGRWSWDEYTRNFDGEDFARILASESVCTNCHEHAKEADWIFTAFSNP